MADEGAKPCIHSIVAGQCEWCGERFSRVKGWVHEHGTMLRPFNPETDRDVPHCIDEPGRLQP